MGIAIIHVVDDDAGMSKDFRCDIKLLLSHMKLLTADLQDVPGQDVEIAVKCDVATFAWLMAYIKTDISEALPQPDLSNCLQLLIASHYLQMSAVLRSSVAYIAASLTALAPTAAVQLCSLSSGLLDRVAKAVQEEALEALHSNCQQQKQQQQSSQQGVSSNPYASTATDTDSCSRIQGSSMHALLEKLYKHKLRALLQQHDTTLLRCTACSQLFASSSHHKLQCPAATHRQQRKLPLHDPDPSWDLQAFLAQQRSKPARQHQQQQGQDTSATLQASQHDKQQQQHTQQQQGVRGQQPPEQQQQQQQQQVSCERMTWRQLYWLVWGNVVVLYCQRCCSHFPARLFRHCGYHPLPPVFDSDVAVGQYPCCGRPAWQPGAAAGSHQPCCSRDHMPYLVASSQHQDMQQQQGRQQGRRQRRQDDGASSVGVDAARALQLLQQFSPHITQSAALLANPHEQEQQQQRGEASTAAAEVDSNSSSVGQVSRRPASQQPQQQQQQQQLARQPVLPLLVKMVNKGAAKAATAATAAEVSPGSSSRMGSRSCTPCNNRSLSVSPLPPICSPRQQQQQQQQQHRGGRPAADSSSRPASGHKPHEYHHRQQQQLQREEEGEGLQQQQHASGRCCAAGGTSLCSLQGRVSPYPGTAITGDQCGDGAHSSSDNSSSDSSSSTGSPSDPREECWHAQPEDSEVKEPDAQDTRGCGSAGSSSSSSGGSVGSSDSGDFCDSSSLVPGGAHATPLSSVMGAVRAAAEARGRRGFGSPGGSSSGGSIAAVRLQAQMGAPLVETFSAGGRRVLSRAGRRPAVNSQPAADSRPSTAASLLSLKQQQQQLSAAAASPSRPGTTSSSSSSRLAPGAARATHAAAAVPAETGGDSSIGTAFNRTLLLELVQQDDAYRMGVLMRRLDALRLQPPPDYAAGRASRQQGVKRGGLGSCQPLTQGQVMQAVNGVLFRGIDASK